jgi:hypothetical protein
VDGGTTYLSTTNVSQPNLVLNSDFSRRTVYGLAMPEVFADLSGTTKIDGGAAGSVAANIFTQGAANNEYAWVAGAAFWQDTARMSATFKATAIAGIYQLKWRINANAWISAKQNNGNFTATYSTAASDGVDQTVANALTINRWYWLELERQGSKCLVKIYDTGGTVPGVTKASSTLLQTLVFTAAFTGAPWTTAGHPSITSDQAAAQWGGISTGNGGVYVETWLPESWAPLTFSGTLGGQAVGIDESADAGPLGKQWAMRAYIPATSRGITIAQPAASALNTAYGAVAPSAAYTSSIYYKTSGASGSSLLTYYFVETGPAGADVVTSNTLTDAAAVVWTRLTQVVTTNSGTRGARLAVVINLANTRTGTVLFMLPQLEQGSVATAWRNAPADDAPIVWQMGPTTYASDLTTTSSATADIDPRDLAANIFLPWDARVRVTLTLLHANSGANDGYYGVTGAAAAIGADIQWIDHEFAAAAAMTLSGTISTTYAAGKVRIAARFATSAGTESVIRTNRAPVLLIEATRGK